MNRVDRKVALPHLIIYSDDQLLLVSSWHLTHACPHCFQVFTNMINVSETQEYTVTCIIYSQSELVFGHVYSVAIAL